MPSTVRSRTYSAEYYVQVGTPPGLVYEALFRENATVHVLGVELDGLSRVAVARLQEFECGGKWGGLPQLPKSSGFTRVGQSHVARIKSAAAALILCVLAVGLPFIVCTVSYCAKPKAD